MLHRDGGIIEESLPVAVSIGPCEACGGQDAARFSRIRLSTGATPWPHHVVDIEHEENTMKTNGKRSAVPTRFIRGRRYTDYDKQDKSCTTPRAGSARGGTQDGPCRVRTYDQGIMSPLL